MQEQPPLNQTAMALRRIQRLLVNSSLLLFLVPFVVTFWLSRVPFFGQPTIMVIAGVMIFAPALVALWLFRRILRQATPAERAEPNVIKSTHSVALNIGIFIALGLVAEIIVPLRVADIQATFRASESVQRHNRAWDLLNLLMCSNDTTFPQSLGEFVAKYPDALQLLVPVAAQQEQIRSTIAIGRAGVSEMIANASDFQYGGAGIPVDFSQKDTRYVVFLSREIPGGELRTVGFNDGHVEQLQGSQLQAVLDKDADERRHNALSVMNWQQ